MNENTNAKISEISLHIHNTQNIRYRIDEVINNEGKVTAASIE